MQNAGNILGVTVGVGTPYDLLAPLAASCFTTQTGCPSIVLGNHEFKQAGVSHPAALRLKLFDFIEQDNVVYFDADWLCLQGWNPAEISNGNTLVACRDFVLTKEWPDQNYDFMSPSFLETTSVSNSEIASESFRHDYIQEIQYYADLYTNASTWINTGFMVLNRKQHLPLLSCALKLYETKIGHHPQYFEQPAINKAIELLETPLKMLPRKWNVLAAYERTWPESVIGLHIKIKRHTRFMELLKQGKLNSRVVKEYFREMVNI